MSAVALLRRPWPMALLGAAVGVAATILFLHWTTIGDPRPEAVPPPHPPLRTIPLGWEEQEEIGDGHMTFRVTSVSLNRDGTWTVLASFANRSHTRVSVSEDPTKGPGARPALTHRVESPNPYQGPIDEPFPADEVVPRLPSVLGPDDGWDGTFTGPARKLPRGEPLRVAFAYFLAEGEEHGFGWVTQHSFQLRK